MYLSAKSSELTETLRADSIALLKGLKFELFHNNHVCFFIGLTFMHHIEAMKTNMAMR